MDMTMIRLEAIKAAVQLGCESPEDLIECAREIEAYLRGTGETKTAGEADKAAA